MPRSEQKIDDKAWLELQVIAAISGLKEVSPDHPFVVAIRAVLDRPTTPEQLSLDLD